MALPNDFKFQFPVPGWEAWLAAAREELGGREAIENLKVLNRGLEINPYYVSRPDQSENFSLQPAADPYFGARKWFNLTKVTAHNHAEANKNAWHQLQSGADGILFDMHATESFVPDVLLEAIFWNQCALSFLADPFTPHAFNRLIDFANTKFPAASIEGCFFWRSVPVFISSHISMFRQWKKFYPLGLIVDFREDTTVEIAEALHRAVALIEKFSSHEAEIVINQIAFSLTAGTDFFMTITKLKALRSLWNLVKEAYQIDSDKPLHIHVMSSPFVKESYQPHGNMIQGSLAALAAIAGGCDSLTVEAEDPANPMMNRIAKNVSLVLRYESHLNKVADPTAGSYFVDSLVQQLSEKAWHKFQKLQSP
jgi:methylmalonyl-CoA mutase